MLKLVAVFRLKTLTTTHQNLQPPVPAHQNDGCHTDSGNGVTGTRTMKQRLNKTRQQKRKTQRPLKQKEPIPVRPDVEPSSGDELPVMVEILANNSEHGDPLESAPEPEAGSSTGLDTAPPDANQQPAPVSVMSFYTKKLSQPAGTGLKPADSGRGYGRKRKASLPARNRL